MAANVTAAAWPTLSESTPARSGMRTGGVARRAIVRRSSPGPSAPNTTARRSGTAMSQMLSAVTASASSPTSRHRRRASWPRTSRQSSAADARDRQQEDLAHADPHRAPAVGIGARRVDHQRVDAERPRGASDRPEVLRVVQPLEHGETRPGRSHARRPTGGRAGVATATTPRCRSNPTTVAITSRRGDVHRDAARSPSASSRVENRSTREGASSTDRISWPESISRSMATNPSAMNSSSPSNARRYAWSFSAR